MNSQKAHAALLQMKPSLMVLPSQSNPGDSHSCLQQQPSFTRGKGTDRMCPPKTPSPGFGHTSPTSSALLLPQAEETWGNLLAPNHQQGPKWPKPSFAQLLDITDSLRAKGRQGRRLDSSSLLLCCLITLKTGSCRSQNCKQEYQQPLEEPCKGGWRKAWLFAAPL